MILVDTSVWIDFLRNDNEELASLLQQGLVLTHPIILGELSVGNITKRNSFLELVSHLPEAREASHQEVMKFINQHKIWGKGIGFFDLHLLCAALINDVPIWTLDKKLANAAKKHGKAY